METERRKRPGNDRYEGRRKMAREEDGKDEATEGEIEEFFAILRRIHAANKYFGNGKSNGGGVTEKVRTWRPSFEWEDFEEDNSVKADGERVPLMGKSKAVLRGLDLNAKPEPEPEQEFEPETKGKS
eukprot:TRINITY_DN1162_c0_g3_i1.p1 TRINITY_DN1162_c0_g3~~TRINITY_DN1162_c0_g3_i1.p1  ORF type:complete len:127 (-),score=14.41 TRINITY_DN1162_c0_g3_i1:87-467(-)